MDSIIVELLRDTLDPKTKVSILLRKAFVIARKLRLDEFHKWIQKELNGYQKQEKVPDYRLISGQIKGWNPYSGKWIPLFFEDPNVEKLYSKRKTGQSIAQLEDLVDRDSSSSGYHMPFPPEIQHQLSQGFGFETEVSIFADRSALVKIIEQVRTIIQDWAMKLEEDGVIGDGLSFSESEVGVAVQSPPTINYFIDSVQNSQIAIGNQPSMQIKSTFKIDADAISDFIKKLESNIGNIDLQDPKKSEMKSEIATLNAQLSSPNPKRSIMKEGLLSIQTILEGASGSVAGQMMMEAGKLLFG